MLGVRTICNALHIQLRFIRICGFSLHESIQSIINVTELTQRENTPSSESKQKRGEILRCHYHTDIT